MGDIIDNVDRGGEVGKVGDIILHVCCAPCFATARATLAGGGGGDFPGVSGLFFYNPNIHPLLEFRRRVKALRVYLERDPVDAEIDDTYGLADFLACVPWRGARRERCEGCYRMRLERVAEACVRKGLRGFSTTLLASREQERDVVARVGHESAEKFGVRFFSGDLRRILPDERMLRGIYKQQYCGCVFSEDERFRGTSKHLYHPEPKEDT